MPRMHFACFPEIADCGNAGNRKCLKENTLQKLRHRLVFSNPKSTLKNAGKAKSERDYKLRNFQNTKTQFNPLKNENAIQSFIKKLTKEKA